MRYFYNYLEDLCRKNVDISHSDTEKHYFRGELEEFYVDLRNKVSFPCVVAESFELSWTNVGKNRECSFIVCAAYRESKNWDLIYDAMTLCEQIGDEFLRRMVFDSEAGDFCGIIEPVSATPLLNEQRLYVGMRYTLRVNQGFNEDVFADKWTDLYE